MFECISNQRASHRPLTTPVVSQRRKSSGKSWPRRQSARKRTQRPWTSKLGLSQTNKKTSKKLGISTTTKTKRKGVRLRKNAVVRGIKVKDAESKRQIREILEGEADGMDGLENADSD